MTDDERWKFEFLVTMLHECCLSTLSFTLIDAPQSAEAFVSQLLEDDVVYLFRSGSDDVFENVRNPNRRLTTVEAVRHVASRLVRSTDDIWIYPTDDAFGRFPEEHVGPLFDYVGGDRDARYSA